MKQLLFLLLLSVSSFAQTVHIRAEGGTPPYRYTLKTYQGSEVETRTSSKTVESFNFFERGHGYQYTITDQTGNTVGETLDPVSFRKEMQYEIIKGISYGSVSEFVNYITSLSPPYTVAGISFIGDNWFRTQADWDNPIWNQPFDHTVERSTYDHPFDQVIREAYKQGKQLRISICFSREWKRLAGQSDAPFAYGENDLQRRPDGRRVDEHTYEGALQLFSFASPKALEYGKGLLKRFCTRNKPAIEDGTISFIAFWEAEAGEATMPMVYKNESGPEEKSFGDFSDVMREKFASFYADKFKNIGAFNAKMGTSITAFSKEQLSANLLLNGPENLQKHFHWFQSECMKWFDVSLQDYTYEQCQFTRKKLWLVELPIWFQGNIFRSKSLNIYNRIRAMNHVAMVKLNSDHAYEPYISYACDQVVSLARTVGAKAMWEPSPAGYEFSVQTLINSSNIAYPYGIHLSTFRPHDKLTYWDQAFMGWNLPAVKIINYNGVYPLITLKIKYKDVCLHGIGDYVGDAQVKSQWLNLHNANPGKPIMFEVDDSDIYADFPQ